MGPLSNRFIRGRRHTARPGSRAARGAGRRGSTPPVRGLLSPERLAAAEISRGRELIANASLDDSGRLSEQEAGHVGDQEVSLRWIMVHMIEEYARHNGHADLIREQIDGSTGA
ncbi:DUF664 domain-containing protein [Streptomyces laculatispora]|nr:DUF664 domain-containing protein [Streptomyces laculatispora]